MAHTLGLTSTNPALGVMKTLFIKLGILPFLLLVAIVFFGSNEPRFFSSINIFNVVRNSTFLAIAAMGQMIVILTAGLDLSVGSTIGISGIVCALIMKSVLGNAPDAIVLAIAAGLLCGLLTGALIGAINGFGVAVLKVSPFMMTLGTMTSLFGLSLTLTSGMPVTGIPDAYLRAFGYGRLFGLTAPILYTAILFALVYFLLNWTTIGRYFYAVGSSIRATHLSGIKVTRQLMLAYIIGGLFSAITGVLLLARVGSAEANNGQPYTLQAIAACVIAGVSLFGGIGKVRDVILGVLFITILTNGMNLIRVEAYVQQVILGIVLILALVADQLRIKLTS